MHASFPSLAQMPVPSKSCGLFQSDHRSYGAASLTHGLDDLLHNDLHSLSKQVYSWCWMCFVLVWHSETISTMNLFYYNHLLFTNRLSLGVMQWDATNTFKGDGWEISMYAFCSGDTYLHTYIVYVFTTYNSFLNMQQLKTWSMCCNKHKKPPQSLSSTDGTASIIGWTKTKQLSLLFSTLFAHIVGWTKPECFILFSELEVFVIHLVLLSWTSIQLRHPAMRVSPIMHSALR